MLKDNANAIKTILVEDNILDAQVVESFASECSDTSFDLLHVCDLRSALDWIGKKHFDIILLDLSLPDSQGIETFRRIYAQSPMTPIVILTGLDDEKFALDILLEGAQFYLVKGRVNSELFARVVRNAIERKRAERQLQDTLSALENKNLELLSTQDQLIQSEKMASIGTLSAGVAHEIKNPLAIVLQGLEALQDELRDTSATTALEYLSRIKNAAMRADKVISGLLMFSRASQIDQDQNDIHPLIQGAIDILANEARINNITVKTYFSAERVPVPGDGVLLQQVFYNLTLNAIEAMPRGGTLTVSTRLHPVLPRINEKQQYHITVEDTGEGMDPEQLRKIFDPFFTTKEPGKGTGLGLSTVYLILQRHRGSIHVKSEKGKGSQFSITLPVAFKPQA